MGHRDKKADQKATNRLQEIYLEILTDKKNLCKMFDTKVIKFVKR